MEPRAGRSGTTPRRESLIEAGRWLADLRMERRMTQRALAAAIGRSPQVLSTYERGLARVPDDVAELLAQALNVGVSKMRSGLGLYADPAAVEHDEAVLRLPRGVRLSDLKPHEQETLQRLMDTYLESVLRDDS